MKRMLRGLLKEIRPLPVIATLTAIYFAFLLAKTVISPAIPLLFLSTFFLLYTVHFLDTYEDNYIRNEDRFKTFKFAHGASGLLKKNELIWGAALSSLLFLAVVTYISLQSGPIFLLLNIFAYVIGVSYSRYLSKNIAASVVAYPLGVLLVMSSAYLLASGTIDIKFAEYSIPVFLVLAASRIWLDLADEGTDKKTGKPNISSCFGMNAAKKLAFLFLVAGMVIVYFQSFSWLLLLPFLFFCRGFMLRPDKGINYIMSGIYMFLIIEIALQYTAIT